MRGYEVNISIWIGICCGNEIKLHWIYVQMLGVFQPFYIIYSKHTCISEILLVWIVSFLPDATQNYLSADSSPWELPYRHLYRDLFKE